MPIRVRLAGLFAFATAVTVVLASVAFVHFLAGGLRSSLDASLRARADLIAQMADLPAQPSDGAGPLASLRGQGEGLAQIVGTTGEVSAYSPGAGDVALLNSDRLAQARQRALVYSTVIGEAPNQEAARDVPLAGEHTRVLALPVARTDGQRVIVVGSSMQTIDAAIARVKRAAVLGGSVAVILAAAAAWLLASAALRPVERMRRQVAEISTRGGDTTIQLPSTRDEIAALAQTMNGLLGRLGEALARERGFVADAGHELRTPLAILRGELELASRPGRSRDYLEGAVAAAVVETDRLARLAEDLLLLARNDDPGALHREPTNLADILGSAAEQAVATATARQVSLIVECPRPLELGVDASRIRQAVDNLVDNAIRHSPEGGTVTLHAASDGRVAVIEVADEGGGFPPAFIAHAFERFRRGDSARAPQDGGTGLGLAIVQSIAESHGGRAKAANRPSGGAVVRIELPVVATT